MFNVSSFNGSHFEFDYGGFQGCEGADVGSDFFIENVMKELDFPNEYFYEKRTGLLYLYYNATSGVAPPAHRRGGVQGSAFHRRRQHAEPDSGHYDSRHHVHIGGRDVLRPAWCIISPKSSTKVCELNAKISFCYLAPSVGAML